VQTIQTEGVEFERKPMGKGASREQSLVVEVDEQNKDKDLDALDIVIP
jgi:type III restriction enzyme